VAIGLPSVTSALLSPDIFWDQPTNITNPHWARVVAYGSFSLCEVHKEGLCLSSGDINRLMMMMIINEFMLNKIIKITLQLSFIKSAFFKNPLLIFSHKCDTTFFFAIVDVVTVSMFSTIFLLFLFCPGHRTRKMHLNLMNLDPSNLRLL
jgi:hypothetical protein